MSLYIVNIIKNKFRKNEKLYFRKNEKLFLERTRN